MASEVRRRDDDAAGTRPPRRSGAEGRGRRATDASRRSMARERQRQLAELGAMLRCNPFLDGDRAVVRASH